MELFLEGGVFHSDWNFLCYLFQAQNQRVAAEYMLRKFRGAAKETEHVYSELVKVGLNRAEVEITL